MLLPIAISVAARGRRRMPGRVHSWPLRSKVIPGARARRRQLCAWLVVACALGGPAPVWAQPTVAPPVLEGSAQVPYPEGAQGAAEVVLDVLIDADGRVSEVDVVAGEPPFAEHAQRAARAFRFAPARRDGVPTAARVRMQIAFAPPAPADMAPAAEPARSTAPSQDAGGAPVEEVLVRGHRQELGQTSITLAEVRALPGAFGDPFRAVEAMPSVTPTVSGLPYFFVRGAPPNNNAYFLDGVRVPLLYHVALGPGVIHPALFEGVELYPGAAPARFGGVAGAIVSGTTRAPSEVARGEVNLRLVDAGALLETPFADGAATALAAGRYGYPGPIVGALSDTELDYWDYQARVTLRVGQRGTLGLLAFGSHDLLAHQDSGRRVEDLASDFHRLDLRYDYAGDSDRARVGLTLGYDSQGADPIRVTNRSVGLRLGFEHALSRRLRLRYGAGAQLSDYGLTQGEPAEPGEEVVPARADPPPTNLQMGVHADVVWQLSRDLELVPGIRSDVFGSERPREAAASGAARVRTIAPAVDPRLSARVRLSEQLSLVTNLGIAHQYQSLRAGALPAPVATVPGFPFASRRLQETWQASQGIEVGLPLDTQLTLTGFGARMTGLTDLTAFCQQIEPPTTPAGAEGPPDLGPYHCPSDTPVRGYSFGGELSLRRSLSERLSGWLSYTLSRSVRRARFLQLDGSEVTATVPSDFDRTHVLSAMLSYAFSDTFRTGARLVLYSGTPYSALAGSVPVPPYNSRRDPAFFRLDVRIEKRWMLGRTSYIALVLEGLNVTLTSEKSSLGQDCEGDLGMGVVTTECRRATIGPITIPSLGVQAAF